MNEKELRAYCDPSAAMRNWIDKHVSKSSPCVSHNLYATAAFTSTVLDEMIRGCFVECGVYAGANPGIMLNVCRRAEKVRTVWLFDSFEGLPKPTHADDDSCAAHLKRGDFLCALRDVRNNLARWGCETKDCRFVKGWFSETIPPASTGPIAILRVDADLYESTKVCMKHLYPKVVDDGFVIVDDWNYGNVRRAVEDVIGELPQSFRILGTQCVFWRKARRI